MSDHKAILIPANPSGHPLRCHQCAAWAPRGGRESADAGECRRRALVDVWPTTQANDWCLDAVMALIDHREGADMGTAPDADTPGSRRLARERRRAMLVLWAVLRAAGGSVTVNMGHAADAGGEAAISITPQANTGAVTYRALTGKEPAP